MAFDLSDILGILERTPAILDTLLRGFSPAWRDHSPRTNAWSANQVLGHLIIGERTDWWPRIEIILKGDREAVFTPFDRNAHLQGELAPPSADLLDTFRALRDENLGRLRALGLAPVDLDRSARHPELGGVTLSQLLATWAAHDLTHIAQISRALATYYKDEVGPWYHPDYMTSLVADTRPESRSRDQGQPETAQPKLDSGSGSIPQRG